MGVAKWRPPGNGIVPAQTSTLGGAGCELRHRSLNGRGDVADGVISDTVRLADITKNRRCPFITEEADIDWRNLHVSLARSFMRAADHRVVIVVE